MIFELIYKITSVIVEFRRRQMFIICAFLIVAQGLSGQLKINSDTSIKDTSSSQQKELKHNIYGAAGLGYNMIFMGSSLSQDKPYYSAGLIYGFNKEVFVSAYSFHLDAFDPFLSFSAFSFNYSHTFNSWFDIAISASRYQVNKRLADTLFSSFIYGDITLGFDWKILYTKISAGALLSESTGAYFQMRNSRYIQINNLFNGKADLSFDPNVNLLFGTLTKTTEGNILSPPYKGGRNRSGSSVTTSSVFTLMEIDMGIPVSFDIGRFTIEAEPGYTIPIYKNTDNLSANGFIFTLGISFRIL